MFRSRKSSTISPLQPPASTDPSSKSMQSTPGQGQPQVQSPPPLLPLLPASQYAHGGRGQAQGFPPPQPAYAGDGIGRASSAGTGTGKGTGAAGAERVKEKRRSGFGWLGGKKKDKEKEEREKINVSIYNRDPFFRIVASDLGERGGCALRAMPLSVGIHGLGPVELFIRLFFFLLTYIRIRRTVPAPRPFPSTARPPSRRHVPSPPLPPKRSPSPPRRRHPYSPSPSPSPSRNTQPGHSHSTSGRRLRPDSPCAPCRQARSRGPKRTRASDHTASISATCSSSSRASTGAASAAGRGKDLRSHRTYPVQPPCRCSRPHPAPHPMAARAPPVGDRRL